MAGGMMRQPLGQYYTGLETKYGLPGGFLARTRAVESANGTNLQNPNSSAGGDFQFINKTAAGIGLRNRFDPYESADAAARLAAQNQAMIVKATGTQPTGADLYVAHQQGPKGYLDLTRGQTTGSAEMGLNGGAGKSAGGFLSMWRDKFNNAKPANLGEGYVPPPVQGANTGQGPTVANAAALPAAAPAAPVNPATDQAYKGGLLGLFGVGDQTAPGAGKDTLGMLGDMAAQPGGGALGGLASAVSKFAAPTQQTQAPGITLQAPGEVHTGDPSLMSYLDPRRRRAAMMGA